MLVLHRPDALMEPEEVAQAFDELESSGKVRRFGEDTFTMKIGGTTYEVSTHFNPNGRQCVFEQFKELILSEHLI